MWLLEQGITPMDAPAYTKRELDEFQLGWLIRAQEQRDAQNDAEKGANRTRPRSHTREKAKRLAEQRQRESGVNSGGSYG